MSKRVCVVTRSIPSSPILPCNRVQILAQLPWRSSCNGNTEGTRTGVNRFCCLCGSGCHGCHRNHSALTARLKRFLVVTRLPDRKRAASTSLADLDRHWRGATGFNLPQFSPTQAFGDFGDSCEQRTDSGTRDTRHGPRDPPDLSAPSRDE
jgi:hypothetical protein